MNTLVDKLMFQNFHHLAWSVPAQLHMIQSVIDVLHSYCTDLNLQDKTFQSRLHSSTSLAKSSK